MPGWDWGRLKPSRWGRTGGSERTQADTEVSRHGRRRGKDKGFYCAECGAPIDPYDTWCPECSLVLKRD